MSKPPVARRSFLSRLGVTLAAAGAMLPLSARSVSGQTPGGSAYQPARHNQDDWLDQLPGKHRMVFDTISPAGIGSALLYASNVLRASQSGYSLTDADTAIVIIARHDSTAFAYTDAMWAKYGALLTKRSGFKDPQTGQPPIINVYNTSGYDALPSMGTTVDSLVKRGVHFGVCQMATRALASSIAGANGLQTNDVYAELASHLVGNAHIVPAGIVALSRAQERGYTVAISG